MKWETAAFDRFNKPQQVVAATLVFEARPLVLKRILKTKTTTMFWIQSLDYFSTLSEPTIRITAFTYGYCRRKQLWKPEAQKFLNLVLKFSILLINQAPLHLTLEETNFQFQQTPCIRCFSLFAQRCRSYTYIHITFFSTHSRNARYQPRPW
jgi:hypothetical protein